MRLGGRMDDHIARQEAHIVSLQAKYRKIERNCVPTEPMIWLAVTVAVGRSPHKGASQL